MDNLEDLTLEELKDVRKKVNELITDREIAEAVAKANHDGRE